MPTISPFNLVATPGVGNFTITASYVVTATPFDVASGQPYVELCRLIGDDTGEDLR